MKGKGYASPEGHIHDTAPEMVSCADEAFSTKCREQVLFHYIHSKTKILTVEKSKYYQRQSLGSATAFKTNLQLA